VLAALLGLALGKGVGIVTAIAADQELLTSSDLIERWKLSAPNALALRKKLYRRLEEWRLKRMKGTRGDGARYRLSDVLKAEARAAGERP